VGAESAVRWLHNAKAELRVLAEPAEQELGGDRLRETGRARYELARGLDGPDDGRNCRGGGRAPRRCRGADATKEAQGYARRHDPEGEPNSEDNDERGQE
jgi:hypothetical protein